MTKMTRDDSGRLIITWDDLGRKGMTRNDWDD